MKDNIFDWLDRVLIVCTIGISIAAPLLVASRLSRTDPVTIQLRAENMRLEQRNAELEYALDKLLAATKEQQAALNVCAEELKQ